MSFRTLILPLLVIQMAWSQQPVPDSSTPPRPVVVGQTASDQKEEAFDPFEGLGEKADLAQKDWEKIAAAELPKIDQTCVADRVHASARKMQIARAQFDAANKKYLEAMGRYTADSLKSLSKPQAEDAPKLDGLQEDLKRAQTQLTAKQKEKADAVAAGGAKESYLNSLDELIKLTAQEAGDLATSIQGLQQAGLERVFQEKEWTALRDLAEQRVRTAESTAQKYAAHYSEIGEAQLAKCIYRIDQNRVKRQLADPGQGTKAPVEIK